MNGASSSESSFDLQASAMNLNEQLPDTQGAVVIEQREKENKSPQPLTSAAVVSTERTPSPLATAAVTGDLASGSLDEDEDEDDDLIEVEERVSKLSVSQKAAVASTYGNEDFEADDAELTDDDDDDDDEPVQSAPAQTFITRAEPVVEKKRSPPSDAWQPIEDDLIDVNENQYTDADFAEDDDAAAEFAAVQTTKTNNRFTRIAETTTTPLDLLMQPDPTPEEKPNTDSIGSGEFMKQYDARVIMSTVAAELQHAQEPYGAARMLLRASVAALQDLRVSSVLEDYESMSRAYDSIGKVHVKSKTHGLDETLQTYRTIEPSRALGDQLRTVFASQRAPFVDVYYAHKHLQCSSDTMLKAMTGIAHVAAATLACRESLPALTAWTNSVIKSAAAHSASFDVYKTQSLSRVAFNEHVQEATQQQQSSSIAQPVPRLSRFQRLAMLNDDLK